MRFDSRLWLLAAAAVMLSLAAPVVHAQKRGGVLKGYNWESPPSASVHEESTNSTLLPFMPIFNNVVLFDQLKPTGTLETIVPDLARSWSWDDSRTKLTFLLTEGVKWHDGKPFTARDVKCTFDLVSGLVASDDFRKNPRRVWYHNVSEITTDGDHAVTFHLKSPQPSFLALLAAGYSPVYPCHVSLRTMRAAPIGTGPFKVASYKRNEAVVLVRNPDYFKPGKPYLDGLEYRVIDNRSTRILAFISGELDLTFVNDVTYPLMKDIKARRPDAVCMFVTGNNTTNMIVNTAHPPFDNPDVRRALALAIDRPAFNTILSEGQAIIGAIMLPPPSGKWGLPPEELAKLPGYGDVEKSQAEARTIMERLGYGREKPLKVKVSTRNNARFRDPAVIFIDQLKKIHVEGELEVVDSSLWFARVQRREYTVGLNTTGVAVDDPDVNLVENYSCKSDRNYTGYCNAEVDRLIFAQSRELDIDKRRQMVWQAERQIIADVARPIILHETNATCWASFVKGVTRHDNSLFNSWRMEDAWLDR